MTHEIDEFLRIFLVGSILRDYPAIDPDIGAFLGNYEIQILIFAHNIKSIAGEHNTHGSLATDHFITYLIYYIGLYQRLLGNQILCGNLQFGFVQTVGREAVLFQCHHEAVLDGIHHQDFIGILFIPEISPFGGRGIYQSLIIDDSYSSPAVGNTVLVAGIVSGSLLIILGTDVFLGIGDLVIIQFLDQVVFNHFLYHVIGRTYHIISGRTSFYLGIHDLVGLELIVDHFDSGLFFEHGDRIGIDIFTPVVDDDFTVFTTGGRGPAAGQSSCGKDTAQKQCNKFFHFFSS